MDFPAFLITSRLLIKSLAITDDSFIFELVNTDGWLRFIGNRNVTSQAEARAYIQKILENKSIRYWVVNLKEEHIKIGIVTYIKRDYLEYPDIGFAFLPAFFKKGYAYEAVNVVLHHLIREYDLTRILATTISENINSISLLKKIGLTFEKEMEVGNEKLHIYGASADKLITLVKSNDQY